MEHQENKIIISYNKHLTGREKLHENGPNKSENDKS